MPSRPRVPHVDGYRRREFDNDPSGIHAALARERTSKFPRKPRLPDAASCAGREGQEGRRRDGSAVLTGPVSPADDGAASGTALRRIGPTATTRRSARWTTPERGGVGTPGTSGIATTRAQRDRHRRFIDARKLRGRPDGREFGSGVRGGVDRVRSAGRVSAETRPGPGEDWQLGLAHVGARRGRPRTAVAGRLAGSVRSRSTSGALPPADLGSDAQEKPEICIRVHQGADRLDRAGRHPRRRGPSGTRPRGGVVGEPVLPPARRSRAAFLVRVTSVRSRREHQVGQRTAVHRAVRGHRHHRVAVRGPTVSVRTEPTGTQASPHEVA